MDVDAALNEVGALTPESTVGDAEQAGEKLRQALAKLDGAEGERVRKDKSLTLKQASNQLQQKVAPVVAARPAEHANPNQLSDDQIDAAAEGEAKGNS